LRRIALQNRVDPFGEIHDVSARGMLMGNRGGRLHDPATRTLGRRRWASRRWISCRLDFEGPPPRKVMGKGYTELFFLDEVTALAAGHRPCFKCRPAEAHAFMAALCNGSRPDRLPKVDAIDRMLHGERIEGRGKRLHTATSASLADGAMIEIGGDAYAIRDGRLLRWSFDGYSDASRPLPAGPVILLTPPAAVAALRAGYRPLWHASAG
jgi:hypothetical protein